MAWLLMNALALAIVVQSPGATVSGAVRDGGTGESLAGAAVSLSDLDRATLTNRDGRYVFTGVPAGPQHLSVRYIGHAPRVLHALVPADGVLEINVSLQASPTRLTAVEVRSPVIVRGLDLGSSAPFPDRTMSIAAVRNHPLLSEPDVLRALGGGDVVLEPESPHGVHVRGGASDHTAYLLDGIPVFSPYHAAGLFSAWNPDALDRLRLSSSAPSPSLPDALAGVVEATSLAPGERLRVQGGISSTQARVTIDGPVGDSAGYLLSLRSGFPGMLAPNDEASYVGGETGDWVAKLEAPLAGGRLRLIGVGNTNALHVAAVTDSIDGADGDRMRNRFSWRSTSTGASWQRRIAGHTVGVTGWIADGRAGADWTHEAGPVVMASTVREQGIVATVERQSAYTSTLAGARVTRGATAYGVVPASLTGPSMRMTARTTVATAFARRSMPLGHALRLDVGASLATAGGELLPGPRVQLQWQPSPTMTVTGSYARAHQFAQSLRNGESVVGNVFPADLYIGSGASDVPVARSDQGVIAVSYRPRPGVHVGAQAYTRRFDGLLLVAPREGEPFATGVFAVGGGASRGLSVEGAVSSARVGAVASYGLQRVQLDDHGSRYIPDHGATHHVEGGLIVYPSPTWSLRVGVTGVISRTSTPVTGGLEWESCNLLDAGCEFAGSPRYDTNTLGGTRIPAYFRADFGVRKHWHVTLGDHGILVALFGTVTNVFDRRNVLTYARDPVTGGLDAIEMRPLAPLVVGLDWRY